MLSLSFVACSDGIVVDNNTAVAQQTYDQESKEHSHSEESDDCSPFCSCQCCQVTVDFFPSYGFTLIPEKNISQRISTYHNDISQETLESLYHPPIV